MINKIAAENVPIRSAVAGDLPETSFTNSIPSSEQIIPVDANANGKNISTSLLPNCSTINGDKVAAIAMVAIIEPQYDSKISEPIPATSPTLSPTLSAITPGLRGSSSGIPASTLPTKSAPTSALFV